MTLFVPELLEQTSTCEHRVCKMLKFGVLCSFQACAQMHALGHFKINPAHIIVLKPNEKSYNDFQACLHSQSLAMVRSFLCLLIAGCKLQHPSKGWPQYLNTANRDAALCMHGHSTNLHNSCISINGTKMASWGKNLEFLFPMFVVMLSHAIRSLLTGLWPAF